MLAAFRRAASILHLSGRVAFVNLRYFLYALRFIASMVYPDRIAVSLQRGVLLVCKAFTPSLQHCPFIPFVSLDGLPLPQKFPAFSFAISILLIALLIEQRYFITVCIKSIGLFLFRLPLAIFIIPCRCHDMRVPVSFLLVDGKLNRRHTVIKQGLCKFLC